MSPLLSYLTTACPDSVRAGWGGQPEVRGQEEDAAPSSSSPNPASSGSVSTHRPRGPGLGEILQDVPVPATRLPLQLQSELKKTVGEGLSNDNLEVRFRSNSNFNTPCWCCYRVTTKMYT